MMNSLRRSILGLAALIGCVSCIEVDRRLGGNLIPVDSQYEIFSAEIPIDKVEMRMTDSLSAFSQTKITIGAVRDDEFGLATRSCALTIVPLLDTLNFGNIQEVKRLHLSAAFDTVSVGKAGQERILQNVYVNRLSAGTDISKLLDANDVEGNLHHESESIIKGTPLLDGSSDLELDFTDAFADEFVRGINGLILTDEDDWNTFITKFPGIWISTDEPEGNGGRLNSFDLQLNYNSSYYYMEGNYGEIEISTIYDGQTEAVDTTFYFYYGALEGFKMSDLLADYSTGSFPQYAFNATSHQSRSLAGDASDIVYVEGGAGIKPVISAKTLISLATKCIQDTVSANSGSLSDQLDEVVINKATIVLPYEKPTADFSKIDNYYPPRLSPTCRIRTDTTSTFMGLTDASSEDEDQGNINRSRCEYSPDITYHLQQLLLIDEDSDYLKKGNYDIWMLVMNLQTTTTTTEGNSDLSEYYQYLAYQSYYSSMYGGYGGYSGYGNSYSNYYSYMMAAMYASGSTSTSTSYELDTNGYYNATLCGPTNSERVPTLKLVFSIPKK